MVKDNVVQRKGYTVFNLKGQGLFYPFAVSKRKVHQTLAEIVTGDRGDNPRACPVPCFLFQDVDKFRVRCKGAAEGILEVVLVQSPLNNGNSRQSLRGKVKP